jgi:hypothetical protein
MACLKIRHDFTARVGLSSGFWVCELLWDEHEAGTNAFPRKRHAAG